jgi:hypothetical protein
MLCAVRTVLYLSLTIAALAVAGPTYRWVDADGVHYSDQPHPGAEQITLTEAPTYHSPDAQPTQPAPSRSERPDWAMREESFRYGSCAVVQPAQDQMLMNAELATIAVQPEPSLRNGDHIVLSFDGQNIDLGNTGQQEYKVAPIDRGTHTVSAVILRSDGKSLCQSPTVQFHVQHPRVQRARPTPH